MSNLALLARSILGGLLLAGPLAGGEPVPARPPAEWSPIGLLRVRDLTPFGIRRLDFIPAHAVVAMPGTWAVEANLSYQNTYVLSENVAEYLEQRGHGDRVKLTQHDVDAILATGEEAYLVDLELGLLDFTAHYRFSRHWGGYVTVPVLSFRDGFFDAPIEGFHDEFGFDTAHRDLTRRDDFQVLIAARGVQLTVLEPPSDGVGDPVLGARYSLSIRPASWNLVVEGAAKVAWSHQRPFLSSGRNDFGMQVSLQRFLPRQALYLTGSTVYFSGSSFRITPSPREVVPSLVLGWERRLTRRSNAILQLYTSPSVVHRSTLDELAAEKYLLSLGFQSRRGSWFYRVAVTENLQNISNTPDVGLTLSVARVSFGA
jgi:hypothetical protein